MQYEREEEGALPNLIEKQELQGLFPLAAIQCYLPGALQQVPTLCGILFCCLLGRACTCAICYVKEKPTMVNFCRPGACDVFGQSVLLISKDLVTTHTRPY
jgi:hypothetical protein